AERTPRAQPKSKEARAARRSRRLISGGEAEANGSRFRLGSEIRIVCLDGLVLRIRIRFLNSLGVPASNLLKLVWFKVPTIEISSGMNHSLTDDRIAAWTFFSP